MLEQGPPPPAHTHTHPEADRHKERQTQHEQAGAITAITSIAQTLLRTQCASEDRAQPTTHTKPQWDSGRAPITATHTQRQTDPKGRQTQNEDAEAPPPGM